MPGAGGLSNPRTFSGSNARRVEGGEGDFGRSLVFGLILFLRQGMSVKPKPITKAEMELFGITRWSKREALEDLERA